MIYRMLGFEVEADAACGGMLKAEEMLSVLPIRGEEGTVFKSGAIVAAENRSLVVICLAGGYLKSSCGGCRKSVYDSWCV
jgi:hypothetical protein